MTLLINPDLAETLNSILVPDIEEPLREVGRILRAEISDSNAEIELQLGFPAKGIQVQLETRIREQIPLDKLILTVESRITAHGVQRNLNPLSNVKNIIAIASGKGGVGKSTTAANIALALVADGASTGILDADIYGPSQPLMLGLTDQRPTSTDGQSIHPLLAYGLQVMSIGFLIDPNQPIAWRGPMVTSALNQLLNQTIWDDLDYLIVDMPPGPGDIQRTLSQQVPVSGAVIVTTPQDIALLDARHR